MNFANPAGLALLLLALPIIAVHVLRPLRREVIVSSTMIWQRMERPVTAAAPWQRLRPSWLLLAQLLALAAIALAVANPQRVTEADLAAHTVFMIDGSGSMNAIDGEPDRLADARAVAIERRAELGDGSVASLIEVGPVPRVLVSSSDDVDEFVDAVASVGTTAGRADFAAAFALAEGLETPEAAIGFLFISDGGLTDEELRLVPPGLVYERVGQLATNRAITDLTVEPSSDGLRARVTVAHTGGPTATQMLRVDVDGATAHVAELELEQNQVEVLSIDLPPGDRVEAFLEGEDLLAIDDRRWAVTARRSAIDVLVVGAKDPFLATALQSIDGVTITTSDTFDVDHDADVVVFDQVAVPADPGAPFLAIAPPTGLDTVDVGQTVEQPAVTLVRSDDRLLRDLDLTEVLIAAAQRLEPGPGVSTLIAGESAPLLLRGRQAERAFLYLAFPVSQSNLPLQVGFPILLDRVVAELGGSALPPTDLVVGDRVNGSGPRTLITDPFDRTVEIPAGGLGPVAELPGFWTIASEGRPSQQVAVNPDTAESALSPASAIPSELRVARPGEDPPQNARSFRPWLILGGLVLLVLEFLLARRRVGVSAKQWRLSWVLRALVAAALALILLNPGFDRQADRVATVFLLDASDSLGSQGRSAAADWVRDALVDVPKDSVAGVVLFGGDARIESLVQSELNLGTPRVVIDPARTDLSAAMRLGAALLPSDARRRLVLVTDGRPTTGDALGEAQRIGDAGIAVDTVIIGSATGTDAALLGIDVPGTVREGEAIPVVATVGVEGVDEVVVSLLRDGERIDSRTAAVENGQATVRFVDSNPGTGVQRYEVEVQASGDVVEQNNTAVAPVLVRSAAGVLLIEGTPGGGSTLAAALEAADISVTVDSPVGITTIEELAEFEAIVLVDVERFDLTDGQTQALAGAVRDTGRGLVTVGGTDSYGLGGYLTSDLEELLPVVSDVLDPQRRQTVAEVLAIDTSGSMGTCHCADGQGAGMRTNGGVNKTDVARAAAARTISALGGSDEVGIVSFDDSDRWVIDLQSSPGVDVVNDALGSLNPQGGTDIRTTLETSAEQLRESNAVLKHIILFSDGFTEPGDLEDAAGDAASLFDEGITVSVIATGEGAADDLRQIAEAGGGRFYEGRNLNRIPELILEEALLASRDFVNEGEFFPQITSREEVVAGLTESPALLGYVATTSKPTARTLLRIGPDADPLLATWQVGLGQSTAWTSDASDRWSQRWASWDGYVDFWARVVRDTFPASDPDVVTSATVAGDTMRIEVDAVGAFADDAAGRVRVTTPSGGAKEVLLDRISDTTFAAEIRVEEAGIYAVGSSVGSGDATINGAALTSRSYSDEYRIGAADPELADAVARATGGRIGIEPAAAFDRGDLIAGVSRFSLVPWLLLLAVVLWPLAVVLSRVSPRRKGSRAVTPTAVSQQQPLSDGGQPERSMSAGTPAATIDPGSTPVTTSNDDAPASFDEMPAPPADPDAAKSPSSPLDALLESKRRRGERD